jgi:hypothetical protein
MMLMARLREAVVDVGVVFTAFGQAALVERGEGLSGGPAHLSRVPRR